MPFAAAHAARHPPGDLAPAIRGWMNGTLVGQTLQSSRLSFEVTLIDLR
jgi:hypothetical protein